LSRVTDRAVFPTLDRRLQAIVRESFLEPAVETAGQQGFRRGRLLDKVGQHTVDTAELFFDDMRVPADHLFTRGFEVVGTGAAGDMTASDHLPVWARLRWR